MREPRLRSKSPRVVFLGVLKPSERSYYLKQLGSFPEITDATVIKTW